jgi:stage II sporulation protein M
MMKCKKELGLGCVIALCLYALNFVIGASIAQYNQQLPLVSPNVIQMNWHTIFLHNLVGMVFCFAGSITLGIASIFSIICQGFYHGIIISASSLSFTEKLFRLLPHGVFELPAIILATGTGLVPVLSRLRKKAFAWKELLTIAGACVLLIFIASLIEGAVCQRVLA